MLQQNDTVAIVGSHPDQRSNAPFDDPNIDIWVFNEAPTKLEEHEENGVKEMRPWAWRVTGVFQMHKPVIYRSKHNRSDPNHWEWLQKAHSFPIWMLDVDPDVPNSVKYPLDEITDTLLGNFTQGDPLVEKKKYFTSTIAFAFALAIYNGYKRIMVYGIEMSSDTEYTYQRDCVAFWVGMALGRGIEIEYHGGMTIFGRPLYGYEGRIDFDPENFAKRIEKLEEARDKLLEKRQLAEREIHRNWKNGNIGQCVTDLASASANLGRCDGRLHEIQRYHHKVVDMMSDAGGAAMDRNEYEGAAAASKAKIEEYGRVVFKTVGLIENALPYWDKTRNPNVLAEVKRFTEAHVEAAYKSGFHQGIFDQNLELCVEYDQYITAAGGAKAVTVMNAERATQPLV